MDIVEVGYDGTFVITGLSNTFILFLGTIFYQRLVENVMKKYDLFCIIETTETKRMKLLSVVNVNLNLAWIL